jgi:hypothetical protein
MNIRIKILLSAAAVAAGIAARSSTADDALVVTPIAGSRSVLPPEPGSLNPLPGSDAWIAAQATPAFLSNRSAAVGARISVKSAVAGRMNDAQVRTRDGVVGKRMTLER